MDEQGEVRYQTKHPNPILQGEDQANNKPTFLGSLPSTLSATQNVPLFSLRKQTNKKATRKREDKGDAKVAVWVPNGKKKGGRSLVRAVVVSCVGCVCLCVRVCVLCVCVCCVCCVDVGGNGCVSECECVCVCTLLPSLTWCISWQKKGPHPIAKEKKSKRKKSGGNTRR